MSRLLAPIRNALGKAKGYGGCRRCGNTWNWTQHHVTDYTPSRGCFPLCEQCWQRLTPAQRVPFYWELWLSWGSARNDADHHWADIEAAVLEGK